MKLAPITVTPVPGLLRAQAALIIAQERYWAKGDEENKRRVEKAEKRLASVMAKRVSAGKWIG
jgi:hypothetical protein